MDHTYFFDGPVPPRGVTARLARLPKPFFGIVGFILFSLLAASTIVIGLGITPLLQALLPTDSPWYQALGIVITFAPIWVVFFIFARRNRFRGTGMTSRRAIRYFVIGALVGLGVLGGGMLGSVLFFGAAFGFDPTRWTGASGLLVAGVLLLVYYVQGTAEEFIFRSMMPRFLARRFTTLTIVIVSSAAFSALHFVSGGVTPMTFVYTFAIGMLFALIAVLSNSLWVVIGAHGLYNWSTTYIGETFVVKGSEAFSPLGFGISISVTAAVGIVIALVVLQLRKPGWHREALSPERSAERRDALLAEKLPSA